MADNKKKREYFVFCSTDSLEAADGYGETIAADNAAEAVNLYIEKYKTDDNFEGTNFLVVAKFDCHLFHTTYGIVVDTGEKS